MQNLWGDVVFPLKTKKLVPSTTISLFFLGIQGFFIHNIVTWTLEKSSNIHSWCELKLIKDLTQLNSITSMKASFKTLNLKNQSTKNKSIQCFKQGITRTREFQRNPSTLNQFQRNPLTKILDKPLNPKPISEKSLIQFQRYP